MQHLPFGLFNPRFYGVSVILGDEDRNDAVEHYGRAKDPGEWIRNTGTPSLNDISTLSAMDHELRHFHDFLLSPIGTVTMGLRMQASINGIQAMRALGQCQGSFVPVPLTRWIEWDAGKRQRWIGSTGRFFGIERSDDLVAVPHVEGIAHAKYQVGAHPVPESLPHEHKLSSYALSAAQAYASMSVLRQRRSQYDMDVSADDVFEATAHLVQMQAVWTGQGEAAAQSLLEFITTSSAKHLMPLQVLWTALQRSSHPVNVRRMTELFTWMLLGSWEELTSSGHPASRYFQVLELAAAAPDADVFVRVMATAKLFHLLDALTSKPRLEGQPRVCIRFGRPATGRLLQLVPGRKRRLL